MIRKRPVRQTVPAALSAPAVLRAAIVVLAMVLFAGCSSPYSSPNWPYGSGGGGTAGGSGSTPLSMDTTPPGVITHLAALTGSGTVNFTWLDPADDDLDYIEIWAGTDALNGTVVGSISKGKQTFTGSGTLGTALYYHFIAVDKAGNRSPAVNYMVTLSPPILADVTNLVGMITGVDSVRLSWADPVSPTFNQAEITHDHSGGPVNVPKGTEQSAWNGLSDTTYEFTVKAFYGGSGTGGVSVKMSLTQDAKSPGAVSGLSAIDGGFGSVELNWTNPGDTDLQYVEITCDPVSGPAQAINVSAGSAGTYTWTGLAGGVTYTFTLTAVDHSGNKSPGASVTGTPLDTTPPAPVTSLARLFGDERVVLSWTDPGDADLDYIQIDYGMAAQQTGKGNGTYTWNNLTNGTPYTFTVKAVDFAGNRSAPVTIGPVSPRPRSTIDDDDFGLDPLFKDVFTVYDKPTWEAALAAITSGGNGVNYVVNVTAAVTGLGPGNFGSVTGVTAALRGAGYSLALGSNGSLISVGANQTLILRDLSLAGKSGNTNAVVYVGGAASQFIMRSGTISGNAVNGAALGFAGGVFVHTGSTFTMEDGTITGNTVTTQNGGGVGVMSGTFNMKGGVISNNHATGSGGGVNIYGGTGVFIKTGGTLYGSDGGANSNTCNSGSGHAVFKNIAPAKQRNNTAWPGDNINSTNNTGF